MASLALFNAVFTSLLDIFILVNQRNTEKETTPHYESKTTSVHYTEADVQSICTNELRTH